MTEHKKVVWSEGMFLRPHHFQQQERHLQAQARLRMQCAGGFSWGLSDLVLDEAALAAGALRLTRARGVFPDGTPFSFSSPDDAPQPLELPVDVRDKRVLLAVGRERGGAREVLFEEMPGSPARYAVVEDEIKDACDVSLEPALLQLGRLRLRLILEDELDGNWLAIGVARVLERRADRSLVLDDAYIPPVLSTGASALLHSWLAEVAGLLDARSETLAQRLGQPGRSGVSEVSEFLMLSAINRHRGWVGHGLCLSGPHPERLFRDLLMLAGDLSTFDSQERRFTAIPEYQHDDLAATFQPLVLRIKRALSAVVEDAAIQIVLEERDQGLRVGHISDASLLRDAGFLLAVHAELPAELLSAHFPAQAKLGPVERIRDLVHLQLPGIGLRQAASVPRQLPYHAGYLYFELEKGGEMWKQLERSGSLALHLAGEFPGLQLEFWAVRA